MGIDGEKSWIGVVKMSKPLKFFSYFIFIIFIYGLIMHMNKIVVGKSLSHSIDDSEIVKVEFGKDNRADSISIDIYMRNSSSSLGEKKNLFIGNIKVVSSNDTIMDKNLFVNDTVQITNDAEILQFRVNEYFFPATFQDKNNLNDVMWNLIFNFSKSECEPVSLELSIYGTSGNRDALKKIKISTNYLESIE